MKNIQYKRALLFILILIAGFARFYNLNWDNGHYLHPDERLYANAEKITLPSSISEFFSTASPLNPHMFYYGPFPLYVYKLFHEILMSQNFLFSGRFVSALLSFLTIPLVYLIGRQLFSKRVGFLAAFIFAFSAGGIQHAHFLTTETMLIFLITSISYLSILAVKKNDYRLFIPLGALIGISYATKITGLTFTLIPFITLILLHIKNKKIKNTLLALLTFIIITVITAILLAPYQLIDHKSFYKEQEYMQGVTYGKYKPPFIIIYEHTAPLVYPLINILPFTFGFVSLPLALVGLFLISKQLKAGTKENLLYLIIILFPLTYFLWSGIWYAKFSRYYVLLFPFLSLWAAYAIKKMRKFALIVILICIFVNGLLFLKIYTRDNTRIEASRWVYKNIPQGSIISGEHWDDNLPLPIAGTNKTFQIIQLSVYDFDSKEKIKTLSENLSRSDYFIISSRRVYYSILKNNASYPLTNNFYANLFDGSLGFKKVAVFTNYPFFISDDFADETFQSYDHPPVQVFKNENRLHAETIENKILDVQ